MLEIVDAPEGAHCRRNNEGIYWCLGSEEERTPFVFPVFCLVLGLSLDEFNKRIRLGRLRFPSSVFQFFVSVVIAVVTRTLLNDHELNEFESKYTWVRSDPEFIMIVLLPILIFDSAFRMNSHAFLVNIKLIGIITFATYALSYALQGLFTLFTLYTERLHASQAFLFAAAVGATDPVAVVALLEEIGAPYRLRTIIEGESLLNDGIAIIAYRLTKAWLHTELNDHVFSGTDLLGLVAVAASVLVGYVFALVAVWVLGHGSIGAGKAEAMLFVFVYGVYALCDVVLHGSGVLGLVAFGLTLSDLREHIRPSIVDEITHAWQFLCYWANCIIFILAGYQIGRVFYVQRTDVTFDSVVAGLLLYPFGLVVRATFLATFYVACEQLSKRRTLLMTDYVCLAWGGLRGALPLLLALEYSLPEKGDTHSQAFHAAELNLTLVSGTVVMSLLVQGTTFELLADRVGLRKRSEYKKRSERRMFDYLKNQRLKEEVDKLQTDHHYCYAGANWQRVGQLIGLFFNPKTKVDENADDESQSTLTITGETLGAPPTAIRSTPVPITASEASTVSSVAQWQVPFDDHLEVARAYLAMLLARVWAMWRRGELSNSTVRFVVSALEHAIDEADFSDFDLFFLIRKWRAANSTVHVSRFLNVLSNFFVRLHLVSPKQHKDAVTRDWWIVFSAALTAVYYVILMEAVHGSDKNRRMFFFFTLLFIIIFFMEQVVLTPKVKKAFIQLKHKCSRSSLTILEVRDCVSALLDLSWFLSAFASVVIVCYLLSPTVSQPCLTHEEHWIASSHCHRLRVLITAFSSYALAVKLLVALPLLLKLSADMLELYVQQRLRITLSALLALERLTEEMSLPREVFPTEREWKRAREINHDLNVVVANRMIQELSENSAYGDLLPVVRTRQAARAILTTMEHGVSVLAQDGLLSEEDVHNLKKRVSKALRQIERNTKVAYLDAVTQLALCHWTRADEGPLIMEFIRNRWGKPIHVNANQKFDASLALYFLTEGICGIFGSRKGSKATGELRRKIEEYKYPGHWINEVLLFPADRNHVIKVKCITKCIFYKLDLKFADELVKQYPTLLQFAATQDCYRKVKRALRGYREYNQRYTTQQLYDWITDPNRLVCYDEPKSVQVEAGKVLLLVQGSARPVNAPQTSAVHIGVTDHVPKQFAGPVALHIEPDPTSKLAYIMVLEECRSETQPSQRSDMSAPFSAEVSILHKFMDVVQTNEKTSTLSHSRTNRPIKAKKTQTRKTSDITSLTARHEMTSTQVSDNEEPGMVARPTIHQVTEKSEKTQSDYCD